MQNSISKSLVVVNNTLEAEGFALAKEYKSITRGDKSRFTKATKADGFDTRLGKLMQKLKAEGGERISSDRLKDCGINGIDKRRRSEALWFVENETACRDFIKASKKGFTSLTALQAAMKPKAAPKPKADTETPVEPEADEKSNVGLDSEADKAETKSASDIAMQALLDCEMNGISKASFLAALKEQLEMLDAANTKAAA
tara:strand:- start:1351 stop:1950 length:600 start_codon:yes stop_codon:yes gene_type:complete